jgi:hypothetical protein
MTAAPLARSAMMLIRRAPSRSTSAPPNAPPRISGRLAAAVTTPVLAALPVVWSTNHGIATSAIVVPTKETALPASRPSSGPRDP